VDEPVYVIFNPHSGKGRGAQFVAPVLRGLAAAPRLEHALTQGPGDEGRLAEEAVRRGFRRIVLHDNPFNKDIVVSEVYETPFRELWMRSGCQLFDPLAKL
jgi:hypothetical protein